MANTLNHKQSSVAGKVPTTTDLALGELAINTTDGKLYLKKNVSGTESIVDLSPVTSVAGKTGVVTLAKGDVGLGNVDNTADASKPISTATQTALDAKQPLDADLAAIAALAGTSGFLTKTAANTWSLDTTAYTANTGTVTSVAVTVPTGLSVSGTPITSSGTLAISLAAGYSIPTTSSQTNWDTAFTDRNNWDGGATGLTAATGRTSLGGSTVGQNVFTLTNPSAVTFPRFNADNTVSALDAASFRTAIGVSSSSGTVTSVGGTGTVSGLSLSGTVTSSGNLTLSGTLAVTPSNFASQTANWILAAPNGLAGVPTFRALVAADVPTLNQNTTGSSGSCTGNAASASSVPWSGVTSTPTTLAGYGITDGGGGFPAGTVMLFVQTAAPTGWTKSTTHNNKALRVVSGTAGSGGTSAFTTAFASRTPAGSVSSSFSSGSAASTTATGSISVSGGSVSATTLTTTQIPSHNHGYSTNWGSNYNSGQTVNNGTSAASSGTGTLFTASIGSSGGGTSHTHGFTNPSASFTGTAHTHTVSGSVSSSFSGTAMDFAVQYVDVIIATKN